MCDEVNCPVHGRVDVRDPFTETSSLRAVTYVGEYAVSTIENIHASRQIAARAVAAAMGFQRSSAPIMTLMTAVFKVGEGVLVELDGLSDDDLMASVVYSQTHTKAPNPKHGVEINQLIESLSREGFAAHDMVVGMVRGGMIPSEQ